MKCYLAAVQLAMVLTGILSMIVQKGIGVDVMYMCITTLLSCCKCIYVVTALMHNTPYSPGRGVLGPTK